MPAQHQTLLELLELVDEQADRVQAFTTQRQGSVTEP